MFWRSNKKSSTKFAFFSGTSSARNTMRQRKATCKPRLEALEDRIVPTNLITNGSFEAGPSILSSGYTTLSGGDTTSIPGWTVTGGSIDDVGNTYWDGSDGSRSLDLAGFANGGVQQTFATTPGGKYQVQFDLSGNPADPGENQPLVKVMGVSAAGQSTQFSFDITGHDNSNMGWVTKTWSFTANSDSTTLAFSSLDDPNSAWGPVLDNVIVTPLLSGFTDHFEGSTLDPFWNYQYITSGSITFPSTAQAHSGQQSIQFNSTQTTDNKDIFLGHSFDEATYGKASVWVYDTGAGQDSSNYAELTISNQQLGEKAYVNAWDYDSTPDNGGSYVFGTPTIYYQNSPIVRTQGWHQFSIDSEPNSLRIAIDGTTVYSGTDAIPFDLVKIDTYGPNWRPAWTYYFDDFQFTPYYFRVNSTTAGVQQFPSVAMDAKGNSVVVWQSQDQDGDAGGIYAQRYDANGDTVGSEFQVNTTTAGTQEQPAVAMAPDGSFIVAWEGNGPGDSYGIFAQRFDAAGNPLGNEFRVNTYTSDIQAGAGVALDTAGDFVITWDSMGQDGSLWGVYGQRYHADGTPVGSEFRVNTTTNSNQDGGRAVAMGTTGNFVVFWQAQTGGGSPWHIYSQRYDANGVPLGGESTVTQMTSGNQFVDSVIMAADGHYAVAFDGSDGNGYGVFLRLFDASGNPLSGDIPVNSTTASDQRNLKVAFDTAGNILATWQSDGQDGSGPGVYGQYFTPTGVRRGSEFRINMTTSGAQEHSAVAINPAGEALVVWQGNGPGDADGIFGQHISSPSYIVVTKTTDDGSAGTLRDAINQVNAGKYNEIDFNIAGTGVQTINLTSQLPTLTASGVFINGLTQGNSGNTSPLIAVNGSGAGSSSDGLLLQGSNCTVSGLIIEHFNNGIEVAGASNTIGGTTTGAGNVLSRNSNAGLLIDSGVSGVQVQGNYIGTNAAGSAALANSIGIEDAGTHNTIGGSVKGARNIISGNGSDGIRLDSTATAETVQGNFLGLGVIGTAALANGTNGIEVAGTNNTIGGASGVNYFTRNYISGNANAGLLIDRGASGNLVLGNFVGLGISGTQGVSNLNGIEIAGSSNTVGSSASGYTNVLSGNKNDGLLLDSTASANLIQGNDVGTDYAGKNAVANSGSGIEILGTGNTLGGTASAARNIVSGNSSDGVRIDSSASGTLVQGNYIGINISGSGLGNSANGLNIAGNNNTVGGTVAAARNVISGNSQDGVLLFSGSSGNQVLGNYIGTNVAGTAAVANSIGVEVASNNNIVGGASSSRNVISGNSNDGVRIDSSASGNLVLGNYIGVNTYDTAVVGNSGNGIEVAGNNNTLGASYAVAPNEISGNNNDGVFLDSGSSGNVVLGNYIGTNHAGTAAVANKVGIEDAGNHNTIGGTVLGARNVLSGNSGDGLLVDSSATGETVQGNAIGVNVGGNTALANGTNGVEVQGTGNTIGGNSANYYVRNFISGNGNDGVLLDSGANGNQVLGNFIGIGVSGTNGVGDLANGIEIAGNSNTVGGTVSGNRNVISGNGNDGVLLDSMASNNLIQGSYLGTDYTGRNAVANSGNGIEIQGTGNTVGGTSGSRNLISGNTNDGVKIDSSASSNQVLGNYIGVNTYDTAVLGNSGNGIEISGSNNTLGASYAVAPNEISGNSNDGVLLDSGSSGNQVLGSYIGTNHAGTAAVANKVGIEDAGNHNTIGGTVLGARNVLSGNSGDGLLLDSSATGETVQGNCIGLNSGGNTTLANGTNGVEVQGIGNTIGGNSGSNYFTRNFISGNTGDGVLLDSGASGNQVLGNFIGVGVSGTNGVGNVANGIEIAGRSNTIGGAISGYRNVISGSGNDGVLIDGTGANNLLQGNFVGTDYTGKNPVANSGNGIEIAGNNNTVGGTVSGAGNVISGNSKNGVLVSAGSGDTISRNSIFANGALGISLASGANNNIAAPSLSSATISGSTLTVTGAFTAPTANVAYVLEFFANLSGDGEGKIYLGALTVMPTSTGTQSFTFSTTTSVTGTNPFITATLTDATGDISEFSSGITVQ